ncbi:MAG: metallophosphoesterase family protein, partial [Bacteroidota bacterium]
MKKILIISDTHSYIDQSIIKYVKQADEVWHAGDIGNIKILTEIEKF